MSIATATSACLEAIAASRSDLSQREEHTRAIIAQTGAMQKRLLKMEPALRAAAERAEHSDQGRDAQRLYLQCKQNITRCEQARQIARKQELKIRAMR